MASPPYETWSREDLITRLRQLDSKVPSIDSPSHSRIIPRRPGSKPAKKFDLSSYPRRKIALKFCYSGWEYNGLVFQSDKTLLPTVEGTLYNALAECKLIDGTAGPQACGWERCGRTDVGVSSAAQVVSLWVRSNIGQSNSRSKATQSHSESSLNVLDDVQEITESDFPSPDVESGLPLLDASEIERAPPQSTLSPSQSKQELRYITILNRILPPSIRILAWSPVSESFSSRFNCIQRHYKYFFTPDGLNVDAMHDAAARLVGEHDFRNLCKLDPAKQLTIFRRKIIRADINPASVFVNTNIDGDDTSMNNRKPHLYVLDLIGNAFLYNQVRHIMSILLLVGTGLEHPSVVTSLLNADPQNPEPPFREDEPAPELVTCKPEYQMADPMPLVLWECSYDERDVKWQTDTDEDGSLGVSAGEGVGRKNVEGVNGLYHQLSSIHTRSLIHAALDSTFLQAASRFHPAPPSHFPLPPSHSTSHLQNTSSQADDGHFLHQNPSAILAVPLGGGTFRRTTAKNYVPLLRRKRLDHVDVVNERWRKGKGERRAARLAELDVDVDGGDE